MKAFVNHIADTLAMEDWRNPVKKLATGQPKMNVRPLSQAQTNTLLALAESYSPTELLKALNKAMLYILLDGVLRIASY